MDFATVGNKVSHIYSTLHRVLIMAESYHSLGVSNPHRKFGVCSSRRLEIRALGNGEVPFFLVTLACLAIYSKKNCL